MSASPLKRNPTGAIPSIESVHIYPVNRARARFGWPALTKGRKSLNSWFVANQAVGKVSASNLVVSHEKDD
jgi:hypothetical protein